MEIRKEILKTKIVDFQKMLPVKLIERELSLPVDSGKIVTVTGVRRSGKTYLLYQTINEIIKSGVSKKRILFLSFDDERINFRTDELDLILQAYRELFPDIDFKNVYIFFDEIQNTIDWERFVRRIYDTESKNIFLSGSNSKMLASDIAGSLRGRTIQFEVFPLLFSEYCTFKNIDTSDLYSSANRARIVNAATSYLIGGGFPEIVLSKNVNPDMILQEYYHVLLFKDIVERYNISNIAVLKYFIARLINNLSKPTSINKIYNEIRSAGLKTDKNFLYQLAGYLDAVYFSFRLKRFETSVLKSDLLTNSKFYFIDNGLVNAISYANYNEYGKLLENSTFLFLRQKVPFQRGLNYYKGRKECDFVVTERHKPRLLVQVSWEIVSDETLKREADGLVEAARKLSCKKLYIINNDLDKVIHRDNFEIKVVPYWKFFLLNFDEI